jgi:hypothetical protein
MKKFLVMAALLLLIGAGIFFFVVPPQVEVWRCRLPQFRKRLQNFTKRF